jgi:hypothetical protein
MKKIEVLTMQTRGGNAAENHFIIRKGSTYYFQSYNSLIAKKQGDKIQLDKYYWDYSATTGRYRNDFLGESIAETRKKIKSGEYKLTNLN